MINTNLNAILPIFIVQLLYPYVRTTGWDKGVVLTDALRCASGTQMRFWLPTGEHASLSYDHEHLLRFGTSYISGKTKLCL